MKNIHVLPTDKPSRLYLTTHEYIFEEGYSLSTDECENKHIYITSDEEIKKGDWYITVLDNEIYKADGDTEIIMSVANKCDNTTYKRTHFKIILTTDADLIKEGVQAIDDEFLEWFVKNPSCEEVKLKEINRLSPLGSHYRFEGYKIILPKEDWLLNNPHCKQIESCSKSLSKKCICPKEELKQDWYCPKCNSYVSAESVTFEETHQICNTSVIVKEEPKQETLEEDFKIWDDLFGILAWKFKPTKSGDMYLDGEKVYEELKSKFKLKRI